MRSKEWIFTRHGTTDIGLNIVNAKNAITSGRSANVFAKMVANPFLANEGTKVAVMAA